MASDKPDRARRAFLARVVQGGAVATTGGLLWTYLLSQQARAVPTAIRPPGALPDAAFNARCIKCGLCVRDCPYDTLSLAAVGDPGTIGTPYFEPRNVPCYMCEDIPCAAACPTGALSKELKDIEKARMGLAVIDLENCLSWQGLRCEICYRECPVKDKAIRIEHHPRKLSKHGKFVPMMIAEGCTGCGICEKACPTQEAAIRVVPPKLVQGHIGDHYRLGWRHHSELSRDLKPGTAATSGPNTVPPATAPGLDYLNSGEL